MIITAKWMARAKEKKSEPPVPSKGRSKMNEAWVYGIHRPLSQHPQHAHACPSPSPSPSPHPMFFSFLSILPHPFH